MELPVLGQQEPAERADAARNRRRILQAATELFAVHGATNVAMEDIAAAAGVGKGTLYRRYPTRRDLANALLDQHDRELQAEMIRGEPPLGPGAPPAERLVAFYAAAIDLLADHLDLALAAHSGERRTGVGATTAWLAHVRVLLRQAGVADPGGALADVLLAPLTGDFVHAMQQRGTSTDDLETSLAELAHRVLG